MASAPLSLALPFRQPFSPRPEGLQVLRVNDEPLFALVLHGVDMDARTLGQLGAGGEQQDGE